MDCHKKKISVNPEEIEKVCRDLVQDQVDNAQQFRDSEYFMSTEIAALPSEQRLKQATKRAEELAAKAGLTSWPRACAQRIWLWAGHVARMGDNRLPKAALLPLLLL